jgi:hypothetical protein
MRAFALMRDPEDLEASFVSSPFYQRNQIAIESLRSALPSASAARYRGIGRFAFTEYPERGPGWQGQDDHYDDAEARARALLLGFLGPENATTPYPRAFLADRRDAATVRAALSRPDAYELVELCTPPESPLEPLGFDVGYWGGGNFSILCDAALWPMWHPVVPAAVPELVDQISELNDYGLFATAEAARASAAWYSSQDWAEREPADFIVIAVGSSSENAGSNSGLHQTPPELSLWRRS